MDELRCQFLKRRQGNGGGWAGLQLWYKWHSRPVLIPEDPSLSFLLESSSGLYYYCSALIRTKLERVRKKHLLVLLKAEFWMWTVELECRIVDYLVARDIKHPKHNITLSISVIFPTCILCNVVIPLFSEIYTFFHPWAAVTYSQQGCIGCCLMFNFKHNCIIAFTANEL